MLNAPTDQELATLPRLYSTKNTLAEDKIIHMHFFLPACNWYAVEFDGQDTFMGFVAIHAGAEWGYFSLSELHTINSNGLKVERDVHWKPLAARHIGIMATPRRHTALSL